MTHLASHPANSLINSDPPPAPAPSARLSSIDAYRGFVMLLMMGETLELPRVAKSFPNSPIWRFLAFHQNHVAWIGCSLHDMIQPSFSFLVGVALPFSLAKRASQGQSQWLRTLHAFWRALILVVLGVFLRSLYAKQTYWTFEDTLSQIGLGYGFLYLLALTSRKIQWAALGVILVGYWLAFAVYPLPGPDFDYKSAGVSAKSEGRLTGFQGHWSLNSNPAWAFDKWFLNKFPREHKFENNGGGYATLSFIPTLATMLLGLLAGGVIRSDRTRLNKIGWLAIAGFVSLGVGWALGALGVCPVVKKIWTPSWVLFSGGICFLMLAGFYLLLDIVPRLPRLIDILPAAALIAANVYFRDAIQHYLLSPSSFLGVYWTNVIPYLLLNLIAGFILFQRSYILIVVGANSIAAYMIAHLISGFIYEALPRHFGNGWIKIAGDAYAKLIHGAAVLTVEWLILWWMYRRRIFLKV